MTNHDIEQFVNYQAPKNLLEDRIILVTGAGAGIGKAAALSFAAHGATVILLGRTLAKLEQTYDQIESAGHPKPAIFPINFESAVEEDYAQLKAAIEDEFGKLDGILHNAGELGARTPLGAYPISDWKKLMQVNVNAPFLLTRSLLPLIQQSDQGRIVFTGSSVGVKGRAYWGAYAVSKGAVETLMQVLADELEESSVRVNSINPGATRTAMRAEAYPAEKPETVTEAGELMNRYLFLFGADSEGWHGLQLDAQAQT